MEYFLCISCEPKRRIEKNPLEVESYEIPLAILQPKGGQVSTPMEKLPEVPSALRLALSLYHKFKILQIPPTATLTVG